MVRYMSFRSAIAHYRPLSQSVAAHLLLLAAFTTGCSPVIRGLAGTASGILVPVAKLEITAPLASIPAGVCSGPFTITALTASNASVSVNTSISIALTGVNSGSFFIDSGCSSSVNQAMISVGTSSTALYFLDNIAETAPLQVSDQAAILATGTFPVTVLPGSPTQLGFSIQPPGSAQACGNFGALPVVAIEDSFGNVVGTASDTVSLATFTDNICSIPTGSSLSVTPALVATTAGIAHFTSMSYPSTASIYIQAKSNSLGLTSGCSQLVNVSAGAAAKLAYVTSPSTPDIAGVNFSTQPKVAIEDACGNIVTTATTAITLGAFTDSGCSTAPATPSIVASTNPMIPVSGQVQFAGTSYTKSGTIYVGAQTPGLTPACSALTTISGGNAASLTLAGFPLSTVAGVSHGFTVTAYDSFGNIATGYTGTVTVGSTDGSAAFVPASHTFVSASDHGAFTFSGTLKTVGTQTISGLDSVNSLSATQSGIVVTVGPADHLTLIGGNSLSAAVGTAITTPPKVRVFDAFGNPVPGAVLTFTIVGGGGSPGAATVTSDSSGYATTSYTLGSSAGANNNILVVAGQTALPGSAGSATITFTESATAGAADHLALIQGNNQSATVNTTIATAPEVEVEDAFNNPVSGINISFTATGGGGSLGAAVVSSGVTGLASTSFTLGTTAGTNNNMLSVAGQTPLPGSNGPASLSFQESATAASANKFAFTVQPSSATANTSIAPVIQVSVQDQYGNTVTSSSASISLAIGTNPGGASLSGTNPVSAVSGIASFSNISLNALGTGYTLTAGNGVLTSATSSAFNITSGKLAFTTAAVNVTAGACSGLVTVQAQDSSSNPVAQGSNLTVNLSATSGTFYSSTDCSGGSTASVQINSGQSSVSFSFKLTLAGSDLVTAQATAMANGTQTEMITAATATQLAFTTQPSVSGTAAANLAVQPVAAVEDTYGNIVITANNSVTLGAFTNSGCTTAATPAIGVTTNPMTPTSGMIAFSGVNYGKATTIYIGATASGLTTACAASSTIISAGGATQLAFTTEPSTSGTAGTSLVTSPVIVIEDAEGNVVTSASNQITLAAFTNSACTTSTGTALNAASNPMTPTSGQASFSGVNYTKVSSIYIGATSTGLTTACSGLVTIAPAVADHLVILAGNGESATVGTTIAVAPKIQVQDVYNNPVPGVALTFTVTGAGGSVGSSPVSSDASGNASTSYTLGTTAGTSNNTLVVAGQTPLVGTPSSVTFTETGTAGAATVLIVAGYPSSVTAGSSNNFSVTAKDAHGNIVPTYTGTIAFTSSDSQAVLPGGYTFSTGDSGTRTFSATLKTTGTQSITVTDSGNSINGSQAGITVNAGSADHLFLIAAGNNQSATAGSTLATAPEVQVLDPYNNPVAGTVVTFTVTTAPAPAVTPSAWQTQNLGTLNTPTVTSNTSGNAQDSYTLGTVIGNYVITVAGQSALPGTTGSASVTFTETANAGTFAAYHITAGAVNPTVGACTAVIVFSTDINGNQVFASTTAATTVTLGTTQGSSTAQFYTSNTCVTPETTMNIAKNSLGQTTHIKDTTYESVNATGTTGAITAASPSINEYSQLIYVSPATPIVVASCQQYTIQNVDKNLNPVNAQASGIVLTPNQGGASSTYTDSGCSSALTGGLTIASGTSTVSFYMHDGREEVLTLSETTSTPFVESTAGSSVTVNPMPPTQIVVTGPTFTQVGHCSQAFQINAMDSGENTSPVSSAVTVDLFSSSAHLTFYSDSGCATPVTFVTIANTASTALFYVQDSLAGGENVNIYTPNTVAMGTFTLTSNSTVASSRTAAPFVAQITASATSVTATSAGVSRCVLVSGAVFCFGANGHDQLGTGDTTDFEDYLPTLAIASGATAISFGNDFACAIVSGGVQCWGDNSMGQVGVASTDTCEANGTVACVASPTWVTGLGSGSGVTAIAAGYQHTCAIQAGAAICWGNNIAGQLGNNSTTNSTTPVPVQGLTSGVTSITAGAMHSCAVSSGAVQCWGYNQYGQIGNNGTLGANYTTPQSVTLLGSSPSATGLASGSNHTCALVNVSGNVGVQCWGLNAYGQLGNGTTTASSVPVNVSGLTSNMASLAMMYAASCVLTTGGAVQCWGHGAFGEIGNGGMANFSTPQPVTNMTSGVTALFGGGQGNSACAIVSGNLQCWGFGASNSLGNYATTNSPIPAPMLSF
jgi:alpha-tubulin suppressor-like RCC1 family protein